MVWVWAEVSEVVLVVRLVVVLLCLWSMIWILCVEFTFWFRGFVVLCGVP